MEEGAPRKPDRGMTKGANMSTNQAGWIIVLLVAIIGLFGYAIFFASLETEELICTIANAVSDRPRWEYRIESPDDFGLRTIINNLGNEGWELAFARRALDSSTEEYNYEMIFKRQRQEAGT